MKKKFFKSAYYGSNLDVYAPITTFVVKNYRVFFREAQKILGVDFIIKSHYFPLRGQGDFEHVALDVLFESLILRKIYEKTV